MNLKTTRQHIDHLKIIYRRLKHTHTTDGTWDWWLRREIEDMEQEIANEHKKRLLGKVVHTLTYPRLL